MTFKIDRTLSSAIKFIAAVIVALHHYSLYICANNLSDSIIYKFLSAQGGFLAVAIFFFLSGYGLMESEKHRHLPFNKFLIKRFLRVYLPVLLITAIWLPVDCCVQGKSYSLGGGIYRLFIDFDDANLWFIKTIIFLYFAFGIFSCFRHKYSKYSMLILNLLTLGCVFLSLILQSDFCIISIPLFTIGVLASLHSKSVTNIVLPSCMIWFVVLCVLLYVVGSSSLLKNIFVNYVFIGLLILILSKFALVTMPKIPLLISNISFDIYLVHGKVLTLLEYKIQTITLIAFLSLTILFSLLFFRLRSSLNI